MAEHTDAAVIDCFQALAERSHEVIVEIGSDMTLTYVSPNAHSVLGIDPDDVIGLDLDALLDRFEVYPRESVPHDTIRQVVDNGPYQPLRNIRGPDGRRRSIFVTVTEFRTLSGEPRLTAVIRDMSHRVDLEEQRLRAQKFESLGNFASGVAHGFNNLLTGVLGNVELAIAELERGDHSRVLPLLWEILATATRAEETTHDILTYAGRARLNTQRLDLTEEVRTARGLLRSAVQGRATIEFNLQSWLAPVDVDAAQLRVVLMNLVLNAAEAATKRNDKVVVTTGSLDFEDHSQQALRSGLPPGAYTFVAVSDSGEGIAEEVQAQVFDPFFTTRETGRGLGLAAALGIATAHGGTILVDSEPRKGATFTVLFPANAEHPRHASQQPGEQFEQEPTVVVVDDEATVRKLVTVGLERDGCRVLSASSAAEALALFEQHGDEVDLLVSDLMMPEMNGEQLLTEVRKLKPDLPVLLISGHGPSSASASVLRSPTVGFVQKPFLLSELSACVRRLVHISFSNQGRINR